MGPSFWVYRINVLNILRPPAILQIPSRGIFFAQLDMVGRTIRIVVTLSLVIATMIQPVSAFAMPPTCHETDDDSAGMCQGCGCCPVEQPEERCCCCTPETSERTETSEKTKVSEPTEVDEATDSAESSVCHCGVSAPPMNHGSLRDQVAREAAVKLGFGVLIDYADYTPAIKQLHCLNETAGSRPDFSQRNFCVWRI